MAATRPVAGTYLARQPVSVALLFILAVVGFLAVAGLSRIYHGQQESLALRWSNRGVADLKAGRFDHAVMDFRTALLHSRDNYTYQLNLAQALLGLKRTDEARAYLLNLWEQQPENGVVNLELARIAAAEGKTEEALRYYHNAIYATWPDDQESQRRETRFELIEFLLRVNAKTQAQSELIALAANLDGAPDQQTRLGELFLRAQDYDHALAAFRVSLKSPFRSQSDLAGSGLAAFQLGRYEMAQRYLQEAVVAAPQDGESAARLETTSLVLEMDPFRRQISSAERNQIVVRAFTTAGARLDSCAADSAAASASLQGLLDKWTKMKPQITESHLRQNPDLVETAMELVFKIEHETSRCGAPSQTDTALLLIAKLHEGT